jgi:hypothetical protein
VTVDSGGKVHGVSVNAAPGLTVKELTAPDSRTGFPGIPHNRVGRTTVGKVRALDVATPEGQATGLAHNSLVTCLHLISQTG